MPASASGCPRSRRRVIASASARSASKSPAGCAGSPAARALQRARRQLNDERPISPASSLACSAPSAIETAASVFHDDAGRRHRHRCRVQPRRDPQRDRSANRARSRAAALSVRSRNVPRCSPRPPRALNEIARERQRGSAGTLQVEHRHLQFEHGGSAVRLCAQRARRARNQVAGPEITEPKYQRIAVAAGIERETDRSQFERSPGTRDGRLRRRARDGTTYRASAVRHHVEREIRRIETHAKRRVGG